jgi:transcriptional regulator with XRE-family HTH domain
MTDRQPVERHHRITTNNAIDLHVGKRLRLRRTPLGLSQEQLGAELNITFQQVQKYERGANRISASRLWDMSQILDVPVSYFFDDMSDTTMRSSPRRVARGVDDGSAGDGEVKDPMARRETLELVRAYYTIEQPALRKRVSDIVRSIATAVTED